MIDATKATHDFIKKTSAVSFLICVIVSIGAILLGYKSLIISILAGFVIANLSFIVLSIVVVFSVTGRKHATLMAILGMIKMGIVGLVLWILLRKNLVEPVTFSIGFSTLVVALLIKGLITRNVQRTARD